VYLAIKGVVVGTTTQGKKLPEAVVAVVEDAVEAVQEEDVVVVEDNLKMTFPISHLKPMRSWPQKSRLG
jgi:hypothetical protein